MGGCVSISLPCDKVVDRFSESLSVKCGYIHNLTDNLESLKQAIVDLKAKRDDVQAKVVREESTKQRERLAQVQVWLQTILAIEKEYDDLLRTSELELQRLCLCGFCSKKFKSSYRYGKNVILMLRKVERLKSEGEFVAVTEVAPRAEVEDLPIQGPIVGQESMLDTVWKRLMDDKVEIVGLYGMGGVGKTTLLTQINNKFLEIRGEFEKVIWVVVSQHSSVYAIQENIGKKLGLEGELWSKKEENERAVDIHRVLKGKKFVLLLDDIWKKWDLSKIGVPSRVNGSKVAFTTRSRGVCGSMGAQHQIEVRCLDSKEAWDLFEHNIGESTLESHPDIRKLAKKVAEECRGLPLALTVISKTMASKTTVQEWHHAIAVLTSYASDIVEVEDEVFRILKYSYDDLKDEHVQSCFLYCSLFPEDFVMAKERLIGYWIGEGFIDEKEGREKAYNRGYWTIGTLVSTCLLLEEIDEYGKAGVKMHDVVRDMALWIASDPGKDKERYIAKGGLSLREIPKVKDWRSVQRLSLMKNDIEKISESVDCPELTTLLLRENRSLKTISGGFFQSMPRLLVLDLSLSNSLKELPEEISCLVSLRYLDLSNSVKISRLCLENLRRLIHLNLEWTKSLKSLQGISKLSSLRTLKLRESRVLVDKSLMKELQLLQHLEFVTADISSGLLVGGEEWSYDSRIWNCIRDLRIKERWEESVKVINLPAMENLRGVWIEDCKMLREIKIERRAWKKGPCLFSNLFHVVIEGCHGLKDLTWLLAVPNLSFLSVQNSKKIEEIISQEKAASLLEKETDISPPFQKLRSFFLEDLPELKSIYWNALPFEQLRDLEIKKCPKLRKLPLDSKTVSSVGIEYSDEEWKERIEWEDEATRQRFLPLFTKSLY